MSGIASAASTTPGSVATFWSCSSERSERIASSSSGSANTRAGTRISARSLAGISQSVSSTWRICIPLCVSVGKARAGLESVAASYPLWAGLDVKHDPRAPSLVLLRHLESMVCHRLDQMRWSGESAADSRLEALLRQIEALGSLRDQALVLDQV